MSALSQRIATSAILLPLSIAAILLLDTGVFALVLAAIVLLGAWEWSVLAGLQGKGTRLAYVGGTAVLLAGLAAGSSPTLVQAVLATGWVWWGLALVAVVRYQRGVDPVLGGRLRRGLAGCLVLVPAWTALVSLHGSGPDGPGLVMFLLAVVWCADIGAFFVGRRWGARRLATRVSPGKSWEGVLGGMVAVALFAALAAAWLGGSGSRWGLLVALALLAAAGSVVGDLLESLLKRQSGLKDSGRILPGHGGVLDRIDSLTAAAPLFVLAYLWGGGLP